MWESWYRISIMPGPIPRRRLENFGQASGIEIESLQGADFDVSLTGFREDEVTDLFAAREDPDDTGSNNEYDEGEFGDEEFAHECPRCGFKFN